MSLGRPTDDFTELSLCEALNNVQLSKRQNIDANKLDNSKSGSRPLVDSTNASGDAGAVANEASMRQIMLDMNSIDHQKQFSATQKARKMLGRDIDLVINAGVVPHCIKFLGEDGRPKLVFEAARVLTNIAAGTSEQTMVVVKAGGVEPLIKLLRSSYLRIVEQSVWVLGNIAGDGPEMRDLLISKGIVPPLVALAEKQNEITLLREVARTISNLCRTENPAPPSEATRQILPVLPRLIDNADTEIVSDACWALAYLSDGPNERIEEIVKSGVIPRLVGFLDSGAHDVVQTSMRAVGNIVTGNDAQTDEVIKAGILAPLNKLLQSSDTKIMTEAAWIVSNICAGTLTQINAAINAGIVPLLVRVLRIGDFPAKKNAACAITNISSRGTVDHMVYLYQQGCIPGLSDMLTCEDWPTIIMTLKGLGNILRGAQGVAKLGKVCCATGESGGLNNTEQLKSDDNTTMEVDENLQSDTTTNGGFQLSGTTNAPHGFNF